jgi:site-specific DNA-methyltransferase (adenine-specific)
MTYVWKSTAEAIPVGGFEVGCFDPPWLYRNKMKKKNRGAECHYPCMQDVAITELPVGALMARDAMIFVWATCPRLPLALEVIGAWGFEYRTVAFVYEKVYKSGAPAIALGNYTRTNAELVLLATRGKILKRASGGVSQIVRALNLGHSHKPDEVYRRIEVLMGERSRVELFARRPRENWIVWGNEVDSPLRLALDTSGEAAHG